MGSLIVTSGRDPSSAPVFATRPAFSPCHRAAAEPPLQRSFSPFPPCPMPTRTAVMRRRARPPEGGRRLRSLRGRRGPRRRPRRWLRRPRRPAPHADLEEQAHVHAERGGGAQERHAPTLLFRCLVACSLLRPPSSLFSRPQLRFRFRARLCSLLSSSPLASQPRGYPALSALSLLADAESLTQQRATTAASAAHSSASVTTLLTSHLPPRVVSAPSVRPVVAVHLGLVVAVALPQRTSVYRRRFAKRRRSAGLRP